MKEEDRYDLLLDEKNGPILVEDECKVFKPILEDFVNRYSANSNAPVENWLIPKMQEQLPEKSNDEIKAMVDEIVVTIKTSKEKQESLEKAIASGRSKESWFAAEAKKATSGMSTQEAAKYFANLDNSL